jgi:hypothetical protein
MPTPFGNAASIYTTVSIPSEHGLGVNVGVPVPREPFSFGGLYGTKSKYGDMDITGDAATEFFTNRIKITTKWPIKRSHAEIEGTKDSANFAGQM